MLTEEQIKNLKKGDPVIIHGTFIGQCRNSDILCKVKTWHGGDDFGIAADSHVYVRPSCVSIPSDSQSSTVNSQPKYDPTRPFKEGDRVRYCERDGRKLFRLQDGAIYEVKSNEGDAGTVEIWLWKEAVRYGSYPYNVFELVTPVEEQEPYRVVWPENYQCVRIMKEKRIYKSIPFDEEECVYRTLEEAKAAAEAECKRLNEEYRKEQNNG